MFWWNKMKDHRWLWVFHKTKMVLEFEYHWCSIHLLTMMWSIDWIMIQLHYNFKFSIECIATWNVCASILTIVDVILFLIQYNSCMPLSIHLNLKLLHCAWWQNPNHSCVIYTTWQVNIYFTRLSNV
jgi:hypothetical protein